MKEEEVRMWDDIYNSKGENIKIIDGQPTYVDPVNGEKIDLSKIGDSPIEKNEQASIDYTNYNSIINNYASTGAGIDDFNYDKIIGGAFRFLGNLDNTKMSSLIFDGYNLDPILGSGPVTTDFLHGVIQQKYGDEIDTPEEFVEKINELKKIGINKAEFGEKGDKTLRQLFLEHEQEKAIDVIKSGDVSTIFNVDEEGNVKLRKNKRTRKRKNNNTSSTVNTNLPEDQKEFIEQTKVKEITSDDFANVQSTTDVMNVLQEIIDEKNSLISKATNPLLKPQDGMKIDSNITIERGTQNVIKILRGGKVIGRFDFNPGGRGFSSGRWKDKTLPALIKEFNNLMTTRFQNQTYAD